MTKKELKSLLYAEIGRSRLPYEPTLNCEYCSRVMDPPGTKSLLEATKDHPEPKSKTGGGITIWACYSCNHIKGNMTFQSWLQYMEAHPRWWEKRILTRGRNMNIQKQEDDNVVSLRKPMTFEPKIITGGLPPSTGNWLMDLPIGTRFTVYSKNDIKNFMCLDLEVVNKTENSVYLYELSSGNPLGGTGRVFPQRFVQLFAKLEIFPDRVEMLPQEETTENNNGDSNRTSDLVT